MPEGAFVCPVCGTENVFMEIHCTECGSALHANQRADERMRRIDDAQEYGVELRLPPAAVDDALQNIQSGMTLTAIGELKLSESPCQVVEASASENACCATG